MLMFSLSYLNGIKGTGNRNAYQLAERAVAELCISKLEQIPKLEAVDKDVASKLCPNNCAGNGECIKGTWSTFYLRFINVEKYRLNGCRSSSSCSLQKKAEENGCRSSTV